MNTLKLPTMPQARKPRPKVVIRDADWVHREDNPNDPGELDDPGVPVAPMAIDYVGAALRPWHSHHRGQLLYAVTGIMHIATATATWVVAPEQAVWVPSGVRHKVSHRDGIAMRTLYIDPEAGAGLPVDCCVVNVTPLLRHLVLRFMEIGTDYGSDGPERRLMMVIMDELRSLKPEPLQLPHPTDPRLLKITDALQSDPSNNVTLSQWAALCAASERTLARLFVSQTGLTFGTWRERLRLMSAIPRLANGDAVTRVALDLGYRNPSAFISMFRRNLGKTPSQFAREKGRSSGS